MYEESLDNTFYKMALMNQIHNVGKEEGQRIIDRAKALGPNHPFITVLQELNDKKA
jgi:hypothetical protein